MFDRQPTLTGELLELRPLRQSDWAAPYAVASDPLIWEQHPDSDRYQEEVFRQFFAAALNSGGALVAIDPRHRIGYRIFAVSRLQPYQARDRDWVDIDQVLFVIGAGNRRSRRAVEKIGAVYLRVAPDASGRERVVYGLTKAVSAERTGCKSINMSS